MALTIAEQLAYQKTLQLAQSSTAGKIEGTSQTYGQLTTDFPQQTGVVTTQNSISTQSTYASSPPEGTIEQLAQLRQQSTVTPEDTLVTIVRQTSDETEMDVSVTKSKIAAAAASDSTNISVVVPANSIVDTSGQDGGSSAAANITNIVPNTTETILVLGSTVKTKSEIKKALTEAVKIDLDISLRSKKSEIIEFNNLKVPDLNVNFVYNFFTENEKDIVSQEDPALDPLLNKRPFDIPRYVNFEWTITETTEPLKGTAVVSQENQQFKQQVFAQKRGESSSTAKNAGYAPDKQAKNYQPIMNDGIEKKVVDIHEPDTAFDSIANAKAFANTVNTVVNTIKGTSSRQMPGITLQDIRQ